MVKNSPNRVLHGLGWVQHFAGVGSSHGPRAKSYERSSCWSFVKLDPITSQLALKCTGFLGNWWQILAPNLAKAASPETEPLEREFCKQFITVLIIEKFYLHRISNCAFSELLPENYETAELIFSQFQGPALCTSGERVAR